MRVRGMNSGRGGSFEIVVIFGIFAIGENAGWKGGVKLQRPFLCELGSRIIISSWLNGIFGMGHNRLLSLFPISPLPHGLSPKIHSESKNWRAHRLTLFPALNNLFKTAALPTKLPKSKSSSSLFSVPARPLFSPHSPPFILESSTSGTTAHLFPPHFHRSLPVLFLLRIDFLVCFLLLVEIE